MYLKYYRLRKEPFHITPDPEFLYLSSGHKKALTSIIYGIEQRKAFIAITGEVGVGKTTILRAYLEKVKQQDLKTIYILNPELTFRELLRMIYHELDAPCERDDVFEMLNGLHHLLIEGYRQNHNFVVFIDEAQNIPLETLENLRMLSNLETPKDKLIEIVLVGQPELLRLLNLRELRQVKQRIAIHSDIPPLSPSESLEYIKYRLKKAGGDIDRIFTKWAINRIIEESSGIPRLMNIICDNALITGFGYQKKLVGRKIVKEVIADLMVRQKPSCPLRWGVALSLLVLIIPLYYFAVPYVKTLIGKNMVEGAPQTATSSVLNGTSVNASLPRDNPGNETLSSQLTSVATSSSLWPNGPDPVSLSTESRRKEKTGLETNFGPKPLPVASMNGGPSPAVAPPESASPDALTTQSPIPSGSPILAGEPVKVTTHPRKSSIRRTIKKGDTLSHLAMEVYGYYGPEIITILRQHNPSIKNPDKIMVGDEVLFPVVDGTKHAQ